MSTLHPSHGPCYVLQAPTSCSEFDTRIRSDWQFKQITKTGIDFDPALHPTMACNLSGDAPWLCEDHVDKPWVGANDREDAGPRGGARMPCPICNRSDREHKPKMPEDG